jgi:undecaprenyl diphosphate synthase
MPASTIPHPHPPTATAAAPASPFAGDPSAIAAVERLRRRAPKADPMGRLPDVHPERIPRHIAIIMDGNGRWAKQRGFPREFGHRNGAAAVRAVIEECSLLGVEVLTLYSFSMENWKRPQGEVSALMSLYMTYLEAELERFMKENLKFRQIGRRDGLAPEVLEAADRLTEVTKHNTGSTLCLAVNYGARAEIVDAVRAIAERVKRGEISPGDIDDATIHDHLYTAGLPDPDLLIRTAGEMRVSNYLLWQISYAELHVTDVLWPDFGAADLHAAIRDYAGRTRKFGGLG